MAYVHQDSGPESIHPFSLPPPPLQPTAGIVSRFVDTSPWSLVFHILECLPPSPVRGETKLILLVHGFPDVAYSWRKVLPELASQGYHSVAFDIRGCGRTFSRKPLSAESFRPVNLVRDALALVSALGYESASCIVGHDFGAVTAAICGLARPDVFKSVVLMSHPVKGPTSLPFGTSPSYGDCSSSNTQKSTDIHAQLAQLEPPRKHYQQYYCTGTANNEMTYPTGDPLHSFLRGYFHLKSADWRGNNPHRLTSLNASELGKMPGYYIMPLDKNMRETVAQDMASEDPAMVHVRSNRWLNDEELWYYVDEWARTSFRGGLNWYRLVTEVDLVADICVWLNMKISVPTAFVSGRQDWGSFQDPGALEALEKEQFVEKGNYRGTVLVDGAGHWVNQEQPEACVREIVKLAREVVNLHST